MLFEIIYVIIGVMVTIAVFTAIKDEIPEIKKNAGADKFQMFIAISAVAAGLIVVWPLIIIGAVVKAVQSKS